MEYTPTNETRIIIKYGVHYHERDDDEDCAPPIVVLNNIVPFDMIECFLDDIEPYYKIIQIIWIGKNTLRIDMEMFQSVKGIDNDETGLKENITEMINEFPLADTVYEVMDNGWTWCHKGKEYALTTIEDVTFITKKELNYYRKKYGA
jgi:hypothetical protein